MNQLTLKLVACITMCLDHVGYHVGDTYLRLVGRIAFPIFAFLIAMGYKRTRDVRRYAARLLIFGIISEPIFDLCFSHRLFDPSSQNVYFTLFLGLCAIYSLELAAKRFGARFLVFTLIPLAFGAAAELICCDYGAWGVALICIFHLLGKYTEGVTLTLMYCVACVLFSFRGYFDALISLTLPTERQIQQVFATLSCIPIALYNGKRGLELKNKVCGRIYQYSFYAFYPLHLLVIGLIFK